MIYLKTAKRGIVYAFAHKQRHIFYLLYFLIYFPWFGYLEQTVTTHFHVIETALDGYIPFCEYFIVPYLLWFAYIAWGLGYFYLREKDEYLRLCATLFSGMTLFLVISTVYPNGHYLRPQAFAHDNIFVWLVKLVYAADTPTNLFPSIHVYNSIAVNTAVWHCRSFRQNHAVRFGSAVLTVSIILSTMFLKQHSVFDVVTGIGLALFMYLAVYKKPAALPAGQPLYKGARRLRQI